MGGYSGDSLKSSAESSFRELDDVFLQTQTRIWLGEVLNMRLDEQIHISDLLADGDILFEVAKVLWNMLLAKCGELRHLEYEPLGSRRSSGRYMPYSNVDSFLKICKILGLNGIDLFSPSDVVEKKNIRKVCICLRALSNKARSKQLKRNNITQSEANYDSLSEESDEAESKFVGEESCCSSMNQLEDDNATDSDADNSFGKYSAVSKNGSEKNRTSRGNGGKYAIVNDKIQFDYSDLNMENDESVIGDSIYDNEMEGSYISSYLTFSDSIIGGTDGSTPVLRKGEENILNFFMAIDSSGSNSCDGTSRNGHQHKYSDNEDAEVSSTTSMSSVLCRVRALDFDDQFDADECLTESSSMLENEADKQHEDSSASHKAGNVATNEQSFHDTKVPTVVKPEISSCSDKLLSASAEPLTDKFVSLHINNSNYFDPDEDMEDARSKDMVCLDTTARGNNLKNVSLLDRSEGRDGVSQGLKFVSELVSNACEPSMTLDGVNMDRNSDMYVLEQNASKGSQETEAGELKNKRRHRPLLKTVARGTALVGVLYLLLHFSLRKNKQESSEVNSRRTQSKKLRGRDFSYGNGQNGRRVDRIYPSDKLKFKN